MEANQQSQESRFSDLTKVIAASEGAATPLPLYNCHKQVWALKIKEIVPAPKPTIAATAPTPGAIIVPELDSRFAPLAFSKEWMDKHSPEPGGYIVFYKDGYRSYSPAAAFDEGYTPAS